MHGNGFWAIIIKSVSDADLQGCEVFGNKCEFMPGGWAWAWEGDQRRGAQGARCCCYPDATRLPPVPPLPCAGGGVYLGLNGKGVVRLTHCWIHHNRGKGFHDISRDDPLAPSMQRNRQVAATARAMGWQMDSHKPEVGGGEGERNARHGGQSPRGCRCCLLLPWARLHLRGCQLPWGTLSLALTAACCRPPAPQMSGNRIEENEERHGHPARLADSEKRCELCQVVQASGRGARSCASPQGTQWCKQARRGHVVRKQCMLWARPAALLG